MLYQKIKKIKSNATTIEATPDRDALLNGEQSQISGASAPPFDSQEDEAIMNMSIPLPRTESEEHGQEENKNDKPF